MSRSVGTVARHSLTSFAARSRTHARLAVLVCGHDSLDSKLESNDSGSDRWRGRWHGASHRWYSKPSWPSCLWSIGKTHSSCGAAGHPLETIKAKIQNQTRGGVAFNGPWDCFRQTLRNEGVRDCTKAAALDTHRTERGSGCRACSDTWPVSWLDAAVLHGRYAERRDLWHQRIHEASGALDLGHSRQRGALAASSTTTLRSWSIAID